MGGGITTFFAYKLITPSSLFYLYSQEGIRHEVIRDPLEMLQYKHLWLLLFNPFQFLVPRFLGRRK